MHKRMNKRAATDCPQIVHRCCRAFPLSKNRAWCLLVGVSTWSTAGGGDGNEMKRSRGQTERVKRERPLDKDEEKNHAVYRTRSQTDSQTDIHGERN